MSKTSACIARAAVGLTEVLGSQINPPVDLHMAVSHLSATFESHVQYETSSS